MGSNPARADENGLRLRSLKRRFDPPERPEQCGGREIKFRQTVAAEIKASSITLSESFFSSARLNYISKLGRVMHDVPLDGNGA